MGENTIETRIITTDQQHPLLIRYFLVMPSLHRIYSNYQTNELITRTVEYTCKQLYVLHRKPFLLQMFGSIAPILDKDDDGFFGDAFKVGI